MFPTEKDQKWALYAKNLIAVQERAIYMLEHYTSVIDTLERNELNMLRYQVSKRIEELIKDE